MPSNHRPTPRGKTPETTPDLEDGDFDEQGNFNSTAKSAKFNTSGWSHGQGQGGQRKHSSSNWRQSADDDLGIIDDDGGASEFELHMDGDGDGHLTPTNKGPLALQDGETDYDNLMPSPADSVKAVLAQFDQQQAVIRAQQQAEAKAEEDARR